MRTIKTYKAAFDLAVEITNTINNDFNISLLTVDSAAMTEIIAKILYPISESPSVGSACQVMYEGNLVNAHVEFVGEQSYDVVIDGLGIPMYNIDSKIWRPI